MLKSYLTLKLKFDLEDHLKSPKSYQKNIFPALFVKNHIFLTWPLNWHTDLENDLLIIKIVAEMDYRQNYTKKTYYTFYYLCLLKIVFLISELTFDELELKLILKITLNHYNNTIIVFVVQNPIKRGITHVPRFIC